MRIRPEVIMAVLGMIAQARREARDARPEVMATRWSFTMARRRVWR